MEFGFHVRSGEGKAEPPKDPDSLVQQASKRMDGSQVAARAGSVMSIAESSRASAAVFSACSFCSSKAVTSWRRLFNSLPTRGRSSLRSRACLH